MNVHGGYNGATRQNDRSSINCNLCLTLLLAENSRLVVESDLVNPERICSEFSKLLANDPSDEVLLHSTLDI